MEPCSKLLHTESTKECQVIGESLTPFKSQTALDMGKSSLWVSRLEADSNHNYRNFAQI